MSQMSDRKISTLHVKSSPDPTSLEGSTMGQLAEEARVMREKMAEKERRLQDQARLLQQMQQALKLKDEIFLQMQGYIEHLQREEQSRVMVESLEQEKRQIDLMEDVMEEELVCSICNELFVKTMLLNCSHSFCRDCIVGWMLRKLECPNCRSVITSCVPCIVLDNTIDRMVAHMGEDLKRKRSIDDRKEKEEGLEIILKSVSERKRNDIYRLLNRRTTTQAAVGSPNNPIVVAEVRVPAGMQSIISTYLAPQHGQPRPHAAAVQHSQPRPHAAAVQHSQPRPHAAAVQHGQAYFGPQQTRGQPQLPALRTENCFRPSSAWMAELVASQPQGGPLAQNRVWVGGQHWQRHMAMGDR